MVVAFCGTAIEYFPFTSVTTPTVVPLTVTVTPRIAPSLWTEEVTVPEMIIVCANNVKPLINTYKTISSNSFFI